MKKSYSLGDGGVKVELTGIAADVVSRLIGSGDAATPEDAVALLASRHLAEQKELPPEGDARIAAAVEEGFRSGEAGEMTAADWADLRSRLDRYLAEKRIARDAG